MGKPMRFLTLSDVYHLSPLPSFVERAVPSAPRMVLAVLLLPVLALAAASPGDWPQFRGPNRDGISTEKGLLQQWPTGGPRLAWKANGLGGGYSSLSIVGNRIFTIGDKGDSSSVLALNLGNGKQVWATRLGN